MTVSNQEGGANEDPAQAEKKSGGLGPHYAIVWLNDDKDWDALHTDTDGFLSKNNIQLLRFNLRHSCRTVIVEREYYCKDYRDTFTNYYSKKFVQMPATCYRLLFFGAVIGEKDWWNVASYKDTFLGYAVVRPNRMSSVGRTVLKPEACEGVQGFLCRQDYKVHLFGWDLTVSGFPYITQDGDVTVCAHAACWMCFRYYSERYTTHPEIYPYQITQLTKDLSGGRLTPSKGLYMTQVVEIFSRYGFHPVVYDREELDRVDSGLFDRLLYYYIESGLTPVVSVPGHAFTVIGHTLDFQKHAIYLQELTSSYLGGLIVHDDGGLPYQYVLRGRPTVKHPSRVSTYVLSDIHSFVVPLPDKIFLPAEDVEKLILDTIDDPYNGLTKRSRGIDRDDLRVRLFLTSSRAFKEQRRQAGMPHGIDRIYALLPMPRFIWLAELSSTTLLKERRCLGEVVWDATAAADDGNGWLAIHYPQYLALSNRNYTNYDIFEHTYTEIVPYAMLEHNLKEVKPPHSRAKSHIGEENRDEP